MKYAFRIVIATLMVALTMAGGSAVAYAAGKAPGGQGLVWLMNQTDIELSNLECSDPTVTDVLLPRGGNATWVVGEPDRMYVLKSISGTGTVTFPDGSETYSFEQSYGHKTGKATLVHCGVDYAIAYDDIVDTGHMEITVAQIW